MNIQKYRPRTLVEGYRVDKELTGKTFVAVPEKKVITGVDVFYENQTMRINQDTPRLKEIEFTDRFGRGKYKLFYYKWTPTIQIGLAF